MNRMSLCTIPLHLSGDECHLIVTTVMIVTTIVIIIDIRVNVMVALQVLEGFTHQH